MVRRADGTCNSRRYDSPTMEAVPGIQVNVSIRMATGILRGQDELCSVRIQLIDNGALRYRAAFALRDHGFQRFLNLSQVLNFIGNVRQVRRGPISNLGAGELVTVDKLQKIPNLTKREAELT